MNARAPYRGVGWASVALAGLVAACALSPLFGGYYDLSVWGPLELVALGAVLVCAVAGRRRLPARVTVGVLALAALAAWAWLSRGWGESADAALVGADRWALY